MSFSGNLSDSGSSEFGDEIEFGSPHAAEGAHEHGSTRPVASPAPDTIDFSALSDADDAGNLSEGSDFNPFDEDHEWASAQPALGLDQQQQRQQQQQQGKKKTDPSSKKSQMQPSAWDLIAEAARAGMEEDVGGSSTTTTTRPPASSVDVDDGAAEAREAEEMVREAHDLARSYKSELKKSIFATEQRMTNEAAAAAAAATTAAASPEDKAAATAAAAAAAAAGQAQAELSPRFKVRLDSEDGSGSIEFEPFWETQAQDDVRGTSDANVGGGGGGRAQAAEDFSDILSSGSGSEQGSGGDGDFDEDDEEDEDVSRVLFEHSRKKSSAEQLVEEVMSVDPFEELDRGVDHKRRQAAAAESGERADNSGGGGSDGKEEEEEDDDNMEIPLKKKTAAVPHEDVVRGTAENNEAEDEPEEDPIPSSRSRLRASSEAFEAAAAAAATRSQRLNTGEGGSAKLGSGALNDHFALAQQLLVGVFNTIRSDMTSNQVDTSQAILGGRLGVESRTTTKSYSFEAGKKIGIKFRGGERQATPVGEQQVFTDVVVSGLEAGGQAQLRYPDIEDGAVLLAVDGQTCRGMSLARCGSLIRGSLLGDASDDPRKRKNKRVALTFSHRFQANSKKHQRLQRAAVREEFKRHVAQMQAQTLRSLEDIFIDLRDALGSDGSKVHDKGEEGEEEEEGEGEREEEEEKEEEEKEEEEEEEAKENALVVDETDTLRNELAVARTQAEKLQQQLDDMRREAVLDRERFMRALETSKRKEQALAANIAVRMVGPSAQTLALATKRAHDLEHQLRSERSEADAKLAAAATAIETAQEKVTKLEDEAHYARTVENIAPHIQRWYRFQNRRRMQRRKRKQVMLLDKWFKILASEIEFHFSRGSDTLTAAVEAMYVMLRTKLRQPHYYGMVKLLELDSTQRTANEIAVDAYELFGEGRNWMVAEGDLLLVATAMSMLRRIIARLNNDLGCTVSEAVFDALADTAESQSKTSDSSSSPRQVTDSHTDVAI